MARAYARCTERLREIVGIVGYVAGGLPGSRILQRLSIFASDDTVRRVVRSNRAVLSPSAPIRYLGVDDWAWKKHQSYGTILVDLERHRVADLLPDRSADSLAWWLEKHPSVEVITRDRGGIYAEGAVRGAPTAMQVADRFHLVVNLSSAIEKVLEERSRELVLKAEPPSETPESVANAPPTTLQTLQLERRQRRWERYQQIIELHERGYPIKAMSRELRIDRRTIRRWLRAGQFPERKLPSGRRQKVAVFADYLQRRWNEGCHNATRLCSELQAGGYNGSRAMVARFVSGWRKTSRQTVQPRFQRIAPKHAAILAARPKDQITAEQQTLLNRLIANCPDMILLRRIALCFRDALMGNDGAVLQKWIHDVKRCPFGPLVRFGYGLQKDIAAVAAAVETPWSNGQVEGQVNRLKAIKRQMYGRAGFALLRARVLPCPQLTPMFTNAP